MRSCIIIPPSTFLDDDKVFPQLGPYYIKRYVEENSDHLVDICNFGNQVISLNLYDVIGFSVTTPQYEYAENLAKKLKNTTTVIGGPHCASYPIESGIFDHVVKHDGCHAFLNILNQVAAGNPSDDKDQLPHRDSSLHEYAYFLDGIKTTTIMTSRGCHLGCQFCEKARTPLRLKSPEAVRQEIQECVDLGFYAIMFFDDVFALNNKRIKKLCEVIKPFNIKFRCFAHAFNFNEYMAETLADAGCVEIGFGAEHAAQKMLDVVDKGTTTKQNYDIVKIAHKYGLRIKAFLLIGLPGENNDTAKELEEYVITSGVDDFDLCIYYPFAGTAIARNPEKFDIIIDTEDDGAYFKGKMGKSSCRIHTSALSSEEIKVWKDRIYSHNKRFLKMNPSFSKTDISTMGATE